MMFANNKKISIRQIRRLLLLDLFGLSSLILPGRLSSLAGPDGIFCIGAAAILGLLYVWMLGKVLNQMQDDYYTYMKKQTGQILSDIFMIFYFFFFLFLSAYVLFQLTSLVKAWLLPEGSYGWICLLLLVLAGYAAISGLEGRARIYEILFWFLGAPVLFMLLLAARGVDTNYWTPIANTGIENFGSGTVTVFIFFLPIFLILFMKPYCAKPEKLYPCAKRVLLLSASISGIIYLILLGTFQSKTTYALTRPVITLMSMVKIPGGFFARLDAFMTAIWFFSLFAFLNTGVFYSSQTLKQLFGEKKTNYVLWAVLVLIFGIAMWFFKYPGAEIIFEAYIKYLALPVLVLLPVLLWVVCGLKNSKSERRREG